jgi:hypothetical protein
VKVVGIDLQFGHLMENKCSEVTLESESTLRTYYTVSPLFAQFADRVTGPRATEQMLVYLETLGEGLRGTQNKTVAKSIIASPCFHSLNVKGPPKH